jgi:hypothetical protein
VIIDYGEKPCPDVLKLFGFKFKVLGRYMINDSRKIVPLENDYFDCIINEDNTKLMQLSRREFILYILKGFSKIIYLVESVE